MKNVVTVATVRERERERERESYTLENSSKALFVCLNNKKVKKYQDMKYLCNFGITKII